MIRIPRCHRRLVGVVAAAIFLSCPAIQSSVSQPAGVRRLTRQDVVVARGADDESWVVGATSNPLQLGFAPDGTLVLRRFAGEDAGDALAPDVPDAPIVIDGNEIRLGDRAAAGVRYAGDRLEEYRNGVRLTLVFSAPGARAWILRHFVAYPGSSVIETWFEVERLDPNTPIVASSIGAWRLAALGRDVHWRHGLLMGQDPDSAFQEQVRTLSEDESFAFGSPGRSSEVALPWVKVQTPSGMVFGGLMWSGGWRIEARGDAAGTQVTARLDDTETEVPDSGALEGVHGFIGFVPGGDAEVAEAMRDFMVNGLRSGHGFPGLVTYNTWFVHGVEIDDQVVDREVELAGELGVELFQLDAGWYKNAGRKDAFDFTTGLGTWEVDRKRFRGGLRGVASRVHAAGMKFALWVEPERTDLRAVGTASGPREEWLAATGDHYRAGVENDAAGHAQICLSHPGAWQWVLDHLVDLVANQGVDYLKIDSNDWVTCTREGHGHGPRDGAFAHVQALYRLLDALRSRFPDLLIENCAGGANRIDLGLARYSDVGWMDDRTTPSAHVRQNAEALSTVLPPSFLLSYAMGGAGEPFDAAYDLRLIARSRMGGVLGLSYRAPDIDEGTFAELSREVEIYKRIRALLGSASAVLLSEPMTASHRPAWELIQHTAAGRDAAVVLAYQNDREQPAIRVVPRRLDPSRTYVVSTIDLGPQGTFPGSVLLRDGFELRGSPNTAARVVLIQAVASSTVAPARARTAFNGARFGEPWFPHGARPVGAEAGTASRRRLFRSHSPGEQPT